MTPLVALAAAAGAIVLLRRRSSAGGCRADLYFEDGSMLSLDETSPEIDMLMVAARKLATTQA
jgi:hypothetical protein